jgi:hypothetical protein
MIISWQCNTKLLLVTGETEKLAEEYPGQHEEGFDRIRIGRDRISKRF